MACNCCRVQVVVPEEITITDNVVDISLPATFLSLWTSTCVFGYIHLSRGKSPVPRTRLNLLLPYGLSTRRQRTSHVGSF